jgi:hypothetical protein
MFDEEMQVINHEMLFFRNQDKKLREKGFTDLANKNAEHLNRLIKSINNIEKKALTKVSLLEKKNAILDFLEVEEYFKDIPIWYMKLFPLRHRNDVLLIDHNLRRYNSLIEDFIFEVNSYKWILEYKKNEMMKPMIERLEKQFFELINPLWKDKILLFKNLTEHQITEQWQKNELPLMYDHRI